MAQINLSALKKTKKKINIKNFEKNLYTSYMPYLMLIRTGGHNRLNNFMLWQLAYTEIFLKKLWPEPRHLIYLKLLQNLKDKKLWWYMIDSNTKEGFKLIYIIIFNIYHD